MKAVCSEKGEQFPSESVGHTQEKAAVRPKRMCKPARLQTFLNELLIVLPDLG